jgi:hypothetical protein
LRIFSSDFFASSIVLTFTRVRPSGMSEAADAQFSAGVRKYSAPAFRAPTVFIPMPPIGPTLPFSSIVPVPATNLPPVRSPGVTLSTMPRENIRPALGPPTSASLMSMVNGKVWSGPAWMPTIARSSSPAFFVVMVMSSLPTGSLPAFSAAAASLAGTMVKTTFSVGSCLVTSSATSLGSLTGVPSTALMTSPACSLPSAGLFFRTLATTTRVCTGMPSSRRAAVLALSWDWLNSSAFSCVDCSSVFPSG